jgi:hypothetical protein
VVHRALIGIELRDLQVAGLVLTRTWIVRRGVEDVEQPAALVVGGKGHREQALFVFLAPDEVGELWRE